jgi:hypothetical protein
MGIVGFALRYRHTFYVLALMMLFLGGSAIRTTPKDIFPNINIPVVSVIRTLDNVWRRRISATYRMVFTRRSTRIPSRIFGGGSIPIGHP